MLHELLRRGLEHLVQMAWLETHPHAIHLGAGFPEERQAFVVVADIQTCLRKDAVRGGFDLLQILFVHEVAGRVRPRCETSRTSPCLPRFPASQ